MVIIKVHLKLLNKWKTNTQTEVFHAKGLKRMIYLKENFNNQYTSQWNKFSDK